MQHWGYSQREGEGLVNTMIISGYSPPRSLPVEEHPEVPAGEPAGLRPADTSRGPQRDALPGPVHAAPSPRLQHQGVGHSLSSQAHPFIRGVWENGLNWVACHWGAGKGCLKLGIEPNAVLSGGAPTVLSLGNLTSNVNILGHPPPLPQLFLWCISNSTMCMCDCVCVPL